MNVLYVTKIHTPIGVLQAIADENLLYYLGFDAMMQKKMEKKERCEIRNGMTSPILSIQNELQHYFTAGLKEFKTPLFVQGTPFQKKVWEGLKKISFGTTLSYAELAAAIGQPLACRAVGSANGVNPFIIIFPCHRVIRADGSLGGYNSGSGRKQWLLNHEKNSSL